ncbi:AMP-binding protein [Acinetobacter sp. XS-4]|uniref:AMP-binding protein n=1 Tax=Acinetobacter sp. XS-4 TaxID=2923375 RepID=UPI00208FA606|nr:AMP-binding protein [Acinetobacter sp. XS-4]USP42240.1 AMP-binding protein [Acinetobacter sp. XS-4]
MRNFIEILFSKAKGKNNAVIYKGISYSYDKLYKDIIQYSLSIGSRVESNNGQKIGFMFDKSYNSLCILLAIMHSGNTYVPLNKKTPKNRLINILKNYGIENIISDENFIIEGVNIINLNDLKNSNNIICNYKKSEGDYAYIIFTSGSTGLPKAVGISYFNLQCFLDSMKEVVDINEDDRVSFYADYFFDFSIAEIFLTIGNSACLVIPDNFEKRNPLKFVEENEITIWMSVPSYVNYCMELNKIKKYILNNVRITIFCGEGLPVQLARSWLNIVPNSKVYNAYGPTEATVFSTVYLFDLDIDYETYLLPIGTDLKNIKSKITLTDEKGIGELFLSGGQVFSGYLLDECMDEWYGTGDMVYKDKYGNYNFVCRNDFQIKRNGYRIDINEIKSIIKNSLNNIELEVIDLDLDDVKKIIFIINNKIDVLIVKNIIDDKLESYMKPDNILVLDRFPLNQNGKLDYSSLKIIAKEILST